MKKFIRPAIIVGIGLTLALLSAGMTYSAQTITPGSATSTALFFQVTATNTNTPPPEDKSVVGSTDGIVIMGVVTALIIIVPILAQRKLWMRIP